MAMKTLTRCPKFLMNSHTKQKALPMKYPDRRFFLAVLFASIALTTVSASGYSATPAEQFVMRIANSVLAAARANSTGQFRALLKNNADIPRIAIYSLGRYRNKLPAARRNEYYQLVTGHISRVFSNHAAKLRGQSLITTGARERGASVIVTSKMKYPSGKTTKVLWRLVKRGGGYKIFDVNVQGIWLANTQKTNFVSVLKRSGGNINALFQYLKK